MSSFIIGGVAGMVGAMYLMQRKPETAKAVTNMMSDVKNDMWNKAASSLFASGASGSSNSSKMDSSSEDKSQKNKQDHASNESLIKNIIENDPQLQSEFNEITKEPQTVKH
ncbi:MAG: hypothetical protein NAG76_20370 [Candidatus Pristimantibacillus lignocellulolyticus]|uniref:YtxH domain-containing protein n=1 Tax=Candidatus Pristimantibacillus lignocellulolyticus TaxID=2994561 RepID=A0A9J6ZD98_9BACL|nr:MAG: hypothetical protein NAG76_20370 [Candidatus Pristimantibacillus lignocellulolyticus]